MTLSFRLGFLCACCIGFLFGCLLAEALPWSTSLEVVAIGLLASLLLVWPRTTLVVGIAMSIGFVGGLTRWHASARAWNISPPTGIVMDITGWIATPLQQTSTGQRAIVIVDQLQQDGAHIHLAGELHIIVAFDSNESANYGDEIRFQAKLSHLPSFGSFDGLRYWRAKGVQVASIAHNPSITTANRGNMVARALFRLKSYTIARVRQILDGPEGTLLLGLLFGDQGLLPRDIADQFRRLGISHLTAVSGYNLTIISLWPLSLFGIIPKRWAIMSSGVLVILFVLFTGAPSSIVRAAIMAFVMLLGKAIGRTPHTMLLILLTATVMALFNPFVVKDDAGFALSFMAFFGLVEIGPMLQLVFASTRKTLSRLRLSDLVSQTFGAQLTTLPYLLGIFGQFSLLAPLANAIILPLVPLIMIVGLALVILALIPGPFFLKLLGLLYYPLHGFLLAIAWAANLRYAATSWPKGGYFPWFLAAMILGWWGWMKILHRTKHES